MSVWLCIPSKRPAPEAQECVDKWRAMGYLVSMHRDIGDDLVDCDYLSYGEYQGYARTTNALIREVLNLDTACDWVVTGGDDTDPDQTKRAGVIAAECSIHFGGAPRMSAVELKNAGERYGMYPGKAYETFGVMQPTGDRFADGSIDRIAGSPWIGREFCQRVYGGRGPYWHEYYHNHVDEELQCVAEKLGVFWQRRDLTHLHRHFMRQSESIDSPAVKMPTPPHLRKAFDGTDWAWSLPRFLGRKAAGFPGAMPA